MRLNTTVNLSIRPSLATLLEPRKKGYFSCATKVSNSRVTSASFDVNT